MQYRAELDGLRAIAAILVVVFHADTVGVLPAGFVGVDLFFILSGFLITSLLAKDFQEHGRIRVSRFYVRRFLRLTPPLFLMLAVYLSVAPLIWPLHSHGRDVVLAALYLGDYSLALFDMPKYLGHTWSLAIEEHFYLVWPIVLTALFRSKHALTCLVLAWVVATVWRVSHLHSLDAFFRFDTRLTGLILGSALYFAAFKGSRAMGIMGLAGLLGVSASMSFRSYNVAIPLAEAFGAMLLVGSAHLPALRQRALTSIGKLSYGIYLWHFPIAFMLPDMPVLITASVLLTTSTVLAAISYWTVEAWARRLRQADSAEDPHFPCLPGPDHSQALQRGP